MMIFKISVCDNSYHIFDSRVGSNKEFQNDMSVPNESEFRPTITLTWNQTIIIIFLISITRSFFWCRSMIFSFFYCLSVKTNCIHTSISWHNLKVKQKMAFKVYEETGFYFFFFFFFLVKNQRKKMPK